MQFQVNVTSSHPGLIRTSISSGSRTSTVQGTHHVPDVLQQHEVLFPGGGGGGGERKREEGERTLCSLSLSRAFDVVTLATTLLRVYSLENAVDQPLHLSRYTCTCTSAGSASFSSIIHAMIQSFTTAVFRTF